MKRISVCLVLLAALLAGCGSNPCVGTEGRDCVHAPSSGH